jgi:flagellar motor switch protein FliN
MTEAAAPARQSEPAEFLQMWADSFSQVVGQITGSAIACGVREEAPPDLTAPGEGDFWVAATCSGALRGEMILRLAGATVLRLAQIFMSEPPTPEVPPTADHREAVVELLRQISGVVASAAKARWGEVQLLVEQASAAPSWSSAGTFWLTIGDEGPSSMALEFGLSAALVAELRTDKADATKSDVAKADAAKPEAAAAVGSSDSSDSSPSIAVSVPPTDSASTTGALDRLLDVELEMTMRFGTRRLLLREVLDLSPGAVIELDRKVQEPVDLLLDGRLIARGEVVVIDGSYGLRVTDVSPLGAG